MNNNRIYGTIDAYPRYLLTRRIHGKPYVNLDYTHGVNNAIRFRGCLNILNHADEWDSDDIQRLREFMGMTDNCTDNISPLNAQAAHGMSIFDQLFDNVVLTRMLNSKKKGA